MATSVNISKSRQKPFISIIMPVYNGEHFLAYALNSILEQDFTNYEIILVDDGSKDKSIHIGDSYAEKDNRITFIKKKNEGVAITRNLALEKVQGEYVMFIDCDDIIYPESLNKIYSSLTLYKPDICRFEFQTIDTNNLPLYTNYEAKRRQKYANHLFNNSDFINLILQQEFYLCMNIFRRDLLTNNHIRFLEGCSYCEDTEFIIQALSHCNKCLYIPHIVYGYRKSETAVTAHFTERNFKDVYFIFNQLYSIAQSSSDRKFANAVKWVSENIGIFLLPYITKYGSKEIQTMIITNCTTHAQTQEWKSYHYFKSKLWKLLYLYKKIKQHLY